MPFKSSISGEVNVSVTMGPGESVEVSKGQVLKQLLCNSFGGNFAFILRAMRICEDFRENDDQMFILECHSVNEGY